MSQENIYTMNIETEKEIYQHPFHLGTDRNVAITLVSEQLAREDVISVRLLRNKKTDTIFHCHKIQRDIDSAFDYDGQEG